MPALWRGLRCKSKRRPQWACASTTTCVPVQTIRQTKCT
ncbi:hypothetical protein EPIB2_1097 [Tritonibacter mobilis]|nr:hypothetical protein EPIB2_1097 [Tritonibacter mobilis]